MKRRWAEMINSAAQGTPPPRVKAHRSKGGPKYRRRKRFRYKMNKQMKMAAAAGKKDPMSCGPHSDHRDLMELFAEDAEQKFLFMAGQQGPAEVHELLTKETPWQSKARSRNA